ncbi:MAG: hypothetical protein OEX18_14605 [Candidatus Krumholzibacteria bacterium]|nr:hypothetical protein [Candidatus Krumholzibacteria bacterium]MDH4338500.1 hypothetical protein [Candidatus Krumholzibacteria bacterium]MDH5270715.1 hypothetical protein [Candidatus Krumholzibacteria bacterium]MDH5628291.1 hypothetical protein [Candidatus Krumholzibacteria bacterium]
MKRTLLLSFALVVALTAVAIADDMKTDKKDAKATVTLTGEVLDMYCYMSHPETGVGAEHAKCANSCIERGLPIGFLASDGTVYLIIGSDHSPANEMVKGWAGKPSMITGTVVEQKGMKAIDITGISEVKG